MLTSGQDEGSRVVLLPFAPRRAEPIAVVKVARRASVNANIAGEQATLAEIRAGLPPALRRSIPQPLGLLAAAGAGGLAVGVETYVPGRALLVSSGRWPASRARQIADLRLAADWLGSFHEQAQVARPAWDAGQWHRWFGAPLDAYRAAFGPTEAEEGLFGAARERSRALAGARLPIVWQHNDYGPWNLFRDGRRLLVIDWEFDEGSSGRRDGPALCDLLYFVMQWSQLVHRRDGEPAESDEFRLLFLDPDPGDTLREAARAVVAGYLARLGIDPGFLPLLLVHTWLTRALDRHRRQRDLGAAGGDGRAGNRYVPYVALLAARAGRLFGDDLAPGGAR
jgi:aminoglycoside phosphotransferase (APT) family kinase protein